jgi:hypothetical protein
MLKLTHQLLQQLDDTGQVVGSGPLLANVDLGHRRCLLTPQWYSVDLEQVHLAVDVVVQTSNAVDNPLVKRKIKVVFDTSNLGGQFSKMIT